MKKNDGININNPPTGNILPTIPPKAPPAPPNRATTRLNVDIAESVGTIHAMSGGMQYCSIKTEFMNSQELVGAQLYVVDPNNGYPHGHPLHKDVFMALESYNGGDTFEDGVRALIAELKEARSTLDTYHKTLQKASAKMRDAHSSMFEQCCSNPVRNAWGKEVDVGGINMLMLFSMDIDKMLKESGVIVSED